MKYKRINIGEAMRILEKIEKEKRCLLLGTSLKPISRNFSTCAKNTKFYKVA